MYDVVKIQEILPHRYPFLLLDRVTDAKAGEYCHGYKNITINEQVFQGHFPGHPIYPGVLIIEGLAQTGAILAFESMSQDDKDNIQNKVVYFMSIDKAKFRAPVKPGDRLDYKLNVIKNKGAIWVLDAKAYVGDTLVSEAELKAMLVDK
jgi:3-hydroxyacyl-[acyl-carrier-protein] dehydratase